MKKWLAVLAAVFCVVVTCVYVLGVSGEEETETSAEYLRIHVRANSNTAEDQQIKYAVKDDVVAYLTPYVEDCTTKAQAMERVEQLLSAIEDVCNASLSRQGAAYTARASVRQESFPTRVYGDCTLESGVYDALIVELGEGTGDNWWCVVYPPLCFTSGGAEVQYRSVIRDGIKKLLGS